MPLRKAGTLDFEGIRKELAEGEHFAVYISNVTTASDLGTIRPLPRGSTQLLVPAGERVVPLIIDRGRLLRAGDVYEVEPDKTIKIHSFASAKRNTADIGSWIKIDYSVLDRVGDVSSLSMPAVELTTEKGTVIRPLLPLRAGVANELALQVFKGVPFGRHKLTIRGDTWETSTLDVKASADAPLTMTTEPLRPCGGTNHVALALRTASAAIRDANIVSDRHGRTLFVFASSALDLDLPSSRSQPTH